MKKLQAKYGTFEERDNGRYLYHGLWSLPNDTKIPSYKGGKMTVDLSAELISAYGVDQAETICREYGQKHAEQKWGKR